MTTFSSKASRSQSHKHISISQSTSTTRSRSIHVLFNKRSNLIPPVKYQYPTIGDPLTTQPTKEMEDLINLTDESIQIQPRVSAISLQLPPFFASNPRLWFANIEALFHIQSVRNETQRYAHVVHNLPFHISEQVQDLIYEIPLKTPYSKLKEAILQRCEQSEQSRLRSLFNEVNLEGQLPSQLLRHMRSLLGNRAMDEAILRHLWSDKLPPHVRAMLITASDKPLTDQSFLADQIMDAYQAPTVSHLSSTSRQTDNSDISQMLQQISERLARLETTKEDQVQHKRPRSRARSPSRNRNSQGICWYHETYQKKALRCKQPCSFQQIPSSDKGNTVATTAASGQNQISCLFYVDDPSNGMKFLVDTGSEVSVIPPPHHHTLKPSPFTLHAANGTTIGTYGQKSLTLDLGLRRRFQWIFVVADVQTPIIGEDFLSSFSLNVDMTNKKLIDSRTSLSVIGSISTLQPAHIHLPRSSNIHIAKHQAAETTPRTDMPSLEIIEVPLPFSHDNILVDVSTGVHRPLVPENLRHKVFLSLHSLSHLGARATSKLVRQRFVWPNMDKDIRAWCRECLSCQKSKIHRHTSAAPASFPLPKCRFQHIHMDLVGPLPSSNGHTHILTVIDRFTRWPVAIPLADTSTETVLKNLISGWVANYGVPETITTDRGSQFSSHLFHQVSKLLGSHHIRTTAYHPAANGMVERFHRQLKSALMAHDSTNNWTELLPIVLLGIRATVKEDLQCSPAELVYGTTLKLPGELSTSNQANPPIGYPCFADRLTEQMRKLKPQQPRQQQRTSYIPKDLATAPQVFIRVDASKPPLHPPYEGPYEVQERHRKYFVINKNGRKDTVSIDRLKPAILPQPSTTTHPTTTSTLPQIEPPTAVQNTKPPMDDKQPLTTRSGRKVHWPKRLAEYRA